MSGSQWPLLHLSMSGNSACDLRLGKGGRRARRLHTFSGAMVQSSEES